jgi:hypothetical protein
VTNQVVSFTSDVQPTESVVRLGFQAGLTGQQTGAIAIGYQAGQLSQQQYAVAEGFQAGQSGQGSYSVAVGYLAGQSGQKISAISIGTEAGQFQQGTYSIAIGYAAGLTSQGGSSIALGTFAGETNQGAYAVAIGYSAGASSQAANSICLNASGSALSPTSQGLFANPIRSTGAAISSVVVYDVAASELRYSLGGAGKTFVVEHPLDRDRYLVHGCLEGPEAGVYYRGTGEIAAGRDKVDIMLPKYCTAFDDFTVMVNPVCETLDDVERKIGASSVRDGRAFTVFSKTPGKFTWWVSARRGRVETEPLKGSKKLRGDGPYVWLE